ncbi:MAG: transporter substrate-binding protein, partial [Pseudomonas sp.]|nr:transporter substrate-binding protein [Pseudomonas sp.]
VTCHGGQNDGRFCDPKLDELLNQARAVNDEAQRQALYFQALRLLATDVPTTYLYFDPRIIAMNSKITGFVPNPDGLIRLADVAFK